MTQEVRRIQGEMDTFEEHGLDAATAANLRQSFAPPAAPGELPPSLIAKIRRKSRSVEYAGAEVRNYCRKFLTRDGQKAIQGTYADYWLENNSKLRDDLYLECQVVIEKALRSGVRDELGESSFSLFPLPANRPVKRREAIRTRALAEDLSKFRRICRKDRIGSVC